MEFAFTDEQQMIRDTADGFLAQISDSEAVRRAMTSEQGYEDAVWQRICTEMYWQAMHIPEQYGGLGLGYVELVALLEQMGRYLLCSPFYSTVCLGANALLVAGNEAQKSEYLPAIAEGSLTATLAYTAPGGRWDADAVQVTAEPHADGFRLNGALRHVPDGHTAQLLIVAARSPGSKGTEGISLFALPADTAGVTRHWLPTMDQTRRQAQVTLSDVVVSADALMGVSGQAWPALQRIIQLATIAISAEQMGGAQQVLDMAVGYSKERYQFNRPVASFQAIKHKAADMMLQAEVARSAVYYAACVATDALEGGPLSDELAEAASVAKAWCSDAYIGNAGDAIQIHGGVGFTWEYDVHLYFKRAKSTEHFLGNGAWHREQVASLLLDQPSLGHPSTGL